MTKTILCVDPGTKYCGIAVFEDDKILASQVITLPTKDPARKRLKEARRVFFSLIEDYAPEVLVIEKPFVSWSEQSKLLDAVIEVIKLLAQEEKMKIREFTAPAVRKTICGDATSTKKDVAELVSSIYPELKIRLNQTQRSRETYWGHMFDAVGLGVCYQKIKQKTQ